MKRSALQTTFQLYSHGAVDVRGDEANNLPVETISDGATPSAAHANLDALPTASSVPAK